MSTGTMGVDGDYYLPQALRHLWPQHRFEIVFTVVSRPSAETAMQLKY